MDHPARILVISPTDLRKDPRVFRQLTLLRENYALTAAGFADPQLPGVEFIPLAQRTRSWGARVRRTALLLFRRYDHYYAQLEFVRSLRLALARRTFDLVIANDAESWPVGVELGRGGRVLLDAHEYSPREFEDKWLWRILYQRYVTNLCRRYLHRGDSCLTVCQGIADEYAQVFGVRPLVLMNTAPRRIASPLPVPPDRIRMIHHGAAMPSRKIENMILALRFLDGRFSLDLMLVASDPRYLAKLMRLAKADPRIRFRPPVPMQKIAEETTEYEVGLFLLEPTNFNYLHALPNKFFEFVQSRLAVVVGPSPEMSRLIKTYGFGLVAADYSPEGLAAVLKTLTPERIAEMKSNAHHAAERLCWEEERKVLTEEVRRLIDLGPCAA